MNRVLSLIIAAMTLPTIIKSDVWIDEEGTKAVEIKEMDLYLFLILVPFIISIKFLEMFERMKLNLSFA